MIRWLRKIYFRWQWRKLEAEYAEMSCGGHLTDYIRPDLAIKRERLIQVIRREIARNEKKEDE